MKKCIKCHQEKETVHFVRRDKLMYKNTCKNCHSQEQKNRYNANPEKYKLIAKKSAIKHKLRRAEESKNTYWKNREERLEKSKLYYQMNKDAYKNKAKEYRQRNPGAYSRYEKERKKKDISFKLSKNLRSRFRSALKKNSKNGSAIHNLGCTIEEFKKYLESKFQPGMTWDNYGEWHIDHIKPLFKFDLTKKENIQKACHYSNLQPLWKQDHFIKTKKDMC